MHRHCTSRLGGQGKGGGNDEMIGKALKVDGFKNRGNHLGYWKLETTQFVGYIYIYIYPWMVQPSWFSWVWMGLVTLDELIYRGRWSIDRWHRPLSFFGCDAEMVVYFLLGEGRVQQLNLKVYKSTKGSCCSFSSCEIGSRLKEVSSGQKKPLVKISPLTASSGHVGVSTRYKIGKSPFFSRCSFLKKMGCIWSIDWEKNAAGCLLVDEDQSNGPTSNISKSVPCPKRTPKAPENGWLEDDRFLFFLDGLFSGSMLVLGSIFCMYRISIDISRYFHDWPYMASTI